MKDASILFSGGPDSTLAALYALEKFDRVHLLTFHHHLMNLTGRQVAVSEELIEIYGKDRIITHLETIDRLYKKCYFTGMTKYICRYRTFYIPWLCGSCKMAMHFKTIDYNMKHNITKTYDGVNIESASYFPAQSLNYIKVFKNIYTSYGMQYDCPVYNINETDKETTKYGLKTTKDTKKEHIFFSTQHTCFIGLLIHAHARLYYRPLRGKNRMSDLAGKFLKQITSDFKYLLPKE